MARKKRRTRTIASTRITDEELIARLQEKEHPLLNASVAEADFEAVLDNLLTQSPDEENQHFYCRPCGEYHLKTHTHHAEMTARKRQKNA
jgi:hypothetical protein